MAIDLSRFAQWARESPQRQYTALMGMLYDPGGLTASFERQAANKGPRALRLSSSLRASRIWRAWGE